MTPEQQKLDDLMKKMGVTPKSPVSLAQPPMANPVTQPTQGADSPIFVERPVEVKSQESDESADLLNKMGEILREYKGEVGSIPVNHLYWGYLNRFKTLRNK